MHNQNLLKLERPVSIIQRIEAIDWDFRARQSESAFSWIHWHPCRFMSQIPAAVVGALSQKGDCVLDPFVGSGTTVVEAQRLGRACIGIDIHPVSILISKAKTLSVSASEIGRKVARIKLNARRAVADGEMISLDEIRHVQLRKWYMPIVQRQLRCIWSSISSLKGDNFSIAFTAFSAILLSVCRETRHWGYVCDNTEPKGDHQRNALREFEHVLTQIEKAYLERDKYISEIGIQPGLTPSCDILRGNTVEVCNSLAAESVDLVITSPPYFGVADYTKSQRLSMEWLGHDIEPIRLIEIGARSKRHRKGAIDQYIHEIEAAFRGVRRVLKPRKPCVVLLGESSTRQSVQDNILEAFERVGFSIQKTLERTISPQRRQRPSLNNESVVVMV